MSEQLRSLIKSQDLGLFQCINLLRKHTDNIGIHHALVQRLYSYTYDELEFFIPQFIQLLVTFETESMALEDFLLHYCSQYPHFCLIVFWYLQAFLFELRNEPESYSFQTVRKFINKLQNILFNVDTYFQSKNSEFRENLQPSLVLCGAVAGAFCSPMINEYVSPIVRSQGKQQKSFVFKLANFQKSLTRNLTMKNQRLSSETGSPTLYDEDTKSAGRIQDSVNVEAQRTNRRYTLPLLLDDSEAYTTDEEELRPFQPLTQPKRHQIKYSDVEDNLKINTVIKSKKSRSRNQSSRLSSETHHELELQLQDGKYNRSSQSLPDLIRTKSRPDIFSTESEATLTASRNSSDIIFPKRSSSALLRKARPYQELLKILQVNYSKKETNFIMSLQNVSLRLSLVPKVARLSALRAELSIINETLLPSEIDVPQLLPITSNKNKKFHKILKLNINEACVLNSAERVPYLLLIEYLSDEIDFNPFSDYNQRIINAKFEKSDLKANDLINVADDASIVSQTKELSELDGPFNEIYNEETDLGELPMLHLRSSSREWPKLGAASPVARSPQVDDKNYPSESPVISSAVDSLMLADQMRIASLMLQQLENSGQSNTQQCLAIKTRIIDSMISLQDQFDSIDYETLKELKTDEQDAGKRKLENDFKLAEDWNVKKQRIRKASAFGYLPNWDLCSVIVKNGDDLPQEAFACQLITMISNIWKKHNVKYWTKRMKILITSANAGLVETITNAMSIHSIKKSLTELSIANGENSKGRIFTLQDYFQKLYGAPGSSKYTRAQENFARSLASYSIICYVLQIKDRHNGNIMLDHEGHLIHIDFGFLLSNSPGSVGFEAAPFKLTTEYVDVLGGLESSAYAIFVQVCKDCFKSLRKEWEQIVSIVELMQKESNLPCFNNGDNTSVLLQQRLQLQLSDDAIDSKTNFKKVSKDVSTIWNLVAPSFKTYFEYLSILESIWYERKNSNLTGGSSISEPQEDYIDLCSSSYEIRKKTKKPLRGQTTKFRIEGAKPSRISKLKRKASNGFKISRSVINCNYGILTEDVFQE
ncbi:Phosphatidylinositol 4-kinase PIK1a [Candida viswanathii]|uniref:1-phosphatidylinositol 4-kinase n=1 Tax=Candida viswanathii TaxID=5486 RepID=A0A367YHZ1_9ASCO|nr:Phosphatidylinositol 4-kinase PIK1a [Candida viswanathii]